MSILKSDPNSPRDSTPEASGRLCRRTSLRRRPRVHASFSAKGTVPGRHQAAAGSVLAGLAACRRGRREGSLAEQRGAGTGRERTARRKSGHGSVGVFRVGPCIRFGDRRLWPIEEQGA